MATAKEIKSKIGSVQNTQKITRAMEMVAASKMRKTQDRMNASRPYAEKMREVISHLAKSHPEYHHLFLDKREEKRAGYIVIGTDRGLCGGLNVNLLKLMSKELKRCQDSNVEFDLCLIGQKTQAFFKRAGGNVLATASQLGELPTLKTLIGIVKVMFDAYADKSIDALYIAHNDFVNTMTQKPILQQLLPLVPEESGQLDYYWDYIYEPDAKEVLELLLRRYMEAQVYQAVVENIACEQAARMVAMKNASENAGNIIDDLQLAYNKARQASITTELADIIGGSEAISD